MDRVDLDGNRAIVRDYKGRTVHPGARWAEDGRIQAALYALAVREQLGVEVVGALYQPIGTADQRPRGVVRDDVPGRYVNGDVSDERDARRARWRSRARDRRQGRRRPARRPHHALSRPLRLQRRLRPPGDLPRVMTRFTPEQRAAIEARTRLLAARRQRRLGQDRRDGRADRRGRARGRRRRSSAILALTFTEKAAGELAERLRRRLTELGEDEHARAVDGAWIGTIHGFCARLLRSQPLAAGLDPRFEVLEETAAERLANAAYERALEAWARAARRRRRSTSPPPTARRCAS